MHDCTVWSLQKSFSSSLTEPEFIVSDFAKWDRPAQLHLAYQSLDAFVKREGQLPRPYNKEDGLKLVELAKKINSEATNKVRQSIIIEWSSHHIVWSLPQTHNYVVCK